MELWQIQEYVIKPQLRTVPGIAEINAYGGYVKQIVVQPKIDKLRDAGLTVSDLSSVSVRTSRMPAAASLTRVTNNSLSEVSAGSLRRKRSRNSR